MMGNTYRFEDFRLDSATRELRQGEKEILLQPRALELLLYLIEHRDRAVSRDELIEAVWNSEYIADSAPGHVIFLIRRALEDRGDEPRFIKTVRRFGYRWIAPVAVEDITPASSQPPTKRHTARRFALLLSLLVVGLVVVANRESLLPERLLPITDDDPPALWHTEAGDIALMLPVEGVEDQHPWVRLGVMDLVSERLRSAGQPMVPSDTVIALLHGHTVNPDQADISRLMSTTGARLILNARAETLDGQWQVSLQTRRDAERGSVFRGTGEDVLEAARQATDRLTLALGLTPAAGTDTDPGLALLLQQVEAAMLAQRMELAGELIDSADEDLRASPEVRWRRASIDYYEHHIDLARAGFESLLADHKVREDPVLHARTLHGLSAIHFHDREYGSAERMLEIAVELLVDKDRGQDALGVIEHSLGMLDLVQGRFDQASVRLVQARRTMQQTGAARSLSLLTNSLGLLEILRDRHSAAAHYLEHAANRLTALNDVGGELKTRANLIQTQLDLLDMKATLAQEVAIGELTSHNTDPVLTAIANAARARALFANGQLNAASSMLAQALVIVDNHQLPLEVRSSVLLLQAEQLALNDEPERAGAVAATLVDSLLPETNIFLDDALARAWLILLRSRIATGEQAEAMEISDRMDAWAGSRHTSAPAFYALLGRAELTASTQGRASAAFEQALAAGAGVPVRRLEAVESYVSWLLAVDRPKQALVVAEQVAEYAPREYRSALLQAQVQHALGPPGTTLHQTLLQVGQLAGERELPTGLRDTAKRPDSRS